MKLWMMNVLACPMCKAYPLKIFIDDISHGTVSFDIRNVQQFEVEYKNGILYKDALKYLKYDSNKKAEKTFKETFQKLWDEPTPHDIRRAMVVLDINVLKGTIVCPICGVKYPIGEKMVGIPEMIPPELYEKEREFIESQG